MQLLLSLVQHSRPVSGYCWECGYDAKEVQGMGVNPAWGVVEEGPEKLAKGGGI